MAEPVGRQVCTLFQRWWPGLTYFMRSSLGPPSFPALEDNEDLAVNLDELSVYQ
jgi:hypothetical protein